MAADGRIVIDTAINTSGFQAGTKQMEAAAKRAAGTLNKIGENARVGFEKAVQVQGGGAQVASYDALEQELNQVTSKIDALIEKQQRFVEIGGNQESMAFKGMEYDIEHLRTRMVELQKQKAALGTPVGGGGKNTFSGVLTGVKRVESGFRNAAAAVKDYNSKSRKVRSSAGIGAKGMTLLALGVSSLLGALMKLRQGLTEGLKNLSKFDKGTNATMSSLSSSLEQVKNSLATAFSPILTAIAPAINTLLSMISNALNAIGEFMAALTGQSTYTRATAVQKDYAASLNGTASAAKNAQKQMSGLDEMTTWQSKQSGGGGGGSGSKAFETVDITNSPIANFAKEIKKKIEEQDFYGVGVALGEKFNEAIGSWDATETAEDISQKIELGMEQAIGFLEGTDWQNIGQKVTEFAFNIDWTGITNNTFRGIGATLGSIGGFIWGLISQGWDYAVELWNGVVTEDGELTMESFFDGVANAFASVVQWIEDNVVTPFVEGFAKGFGLDEDSSVLYEQGTQIIEQLFDGISEGIKDIERWIYVNVVEPFINSFCKLFGIHSPSTVMHDLGLNIVQGLVNAIKSIPQKVGAYFTALKTKVTTICSSITKWIGGAFKTDWSKKIGALGGDPLNALLKNIKNIWNGIKTTFNGIVTFVKGVFTGNWKQAWEGVKKAFSGVFNTFVSVAKAPINAIIGLINGLISALNTAINGINKIKVNIPSWVPLVGGNSIGFNIPKLSKIPYLASGAVIPPNAPFTAMLGDQRHGTNLEAPESLIRQIVREESGQGSYTFVAQINRRTIFKEVIDEAKLQQARTGKNPFALA